MPYVIEFDPAAERHLESFRPYEQAIIVDTVEEQLTHTPTQITRNKFPLEDDPQHRWELRMDLGIRAFYIIVEGEERIRILAIGRKDRSRLIVNGEEYPL